MSSHYRNKVVVCAQEQAGRAWSWRAATMRISGVALRSPKSLESAIGVSPTPGVRSWHSAAGFWASMRSISFMTETAGSLPTRTVQVYVKSTPVQKAMMTERSTALRRCLRGAKDILFKIELAGAGSRCEAAAAA